MQAAGQLLCWESSIVVTRSCLLLEWQHSSNVGPSLAWVLDEVHMHLINA